MELQEIAIDMRDFDMNSLRAFRPRRIRGRIFTLNANIVVVDQFLNFLR